MKLAHIVPTEYLNLLPKEQELYLALSNLIISDPEYRAFHCDQVSAGKTVILDNPVHEYKATNVSEWLHAIQLLRPTITSLPDVIESSIETIKLARYGAAAARQIDPKIRIMGVAHGDFDQQFLECARQLIRQSQVDIIGISLERRLNDDQLAYLVRKRRLDMLLDYREFHEVDYHLLGISETAEELRQPFFQQACATADASKFAVWFLTANTVLPPAPVTIPYPGRAALDGSMGYFDYTVPIGYTARDHEEFTRNLSKWTKYADDGEY